MPNYKEYKQKKTLPRMQRKQSRQSVWMFNKKARKLLQAARLARRLSQFESVE